MNDYTALEQAIDAGISSMHGQVAQDQGILAALAAAKQILVDGYASDQAKIDAAIAAQVGSVQAENITLKADVDTLTSDKATLQRALDTANQSIAAMTSVLANLGYNPDGTPLA